jgi:predicted nucleotidyltransferase
MNSYVNVSTQQIAAFCQRNHIRKLSLFGSVVRDDFRSDSDIDVLVEFEPEVRVGLFAMGAMQVDLSEMFGREVDLKTPEDLSQYFRQKVLDSAQALYG